MHTWDFINIFLSILVICLHTSCLYLLVKKKHSNKHCFIASILTFELVLCVCMLLYYPIYNRFPRAYHKYRALLSALNIPYTCSMVLLTLERFLEVYLHLKYYISWFNKHRIKLCLLSWLAMVVYALAMLIAFTSYGVDEKSFLTVYSVYRYTFQALILLLFLVVYSYLYTKFKKMLFLPGGGRHGGLRIVRQAQQNSVFVPFFMVLSFILFVTVPTFMYLESSKPHAWKFILNRLHFLTDGLLYMVLEPKIRQSVVEMVPCWCKRSNSSQKVDKIVVRDENNAICETIVI